MNHWTKSSTKDFAYSIALDFFTQIEQRLTTSSISRKEYASRIEVDPSRVSQFLNSPPENPKVESLVKYARALGLKISLVAYDDQDPDNDKGPVFSGIFERTWKDAGAPRDFFQIRQPNLVLLCGDCNIDSWQGLQEGSTGRRSMTIPTEQMRPCTATNEGG